MRSTGYNSTRARFDVQMTPMIDVVFQLLIFFVCTVSFQKQEQSLPATPRQTSSASGGGGAEQTIPRELEDLRQVEVVLKRQAGRTQWLVNQDLCRTADDLRTRLTRLAKIADYKRIVPVVLDAADDVPLGDAVAVYDLCLTLGYEKVQFVTPE